MQTVQVVDTGIGGYYSNTEFAVHGSMVTITLARGNERVSCSDILTWEDSMANNDVFDEWAECAAEGDEGYTHYTTA